ncbi:MAG: dehydrogenase [Sphingomonas bacterium]|uniref:SDR family NAD(P)-dependent oxidoreductase n=1 Tax=Sphingomonas bacterium TaxID=1895847 RepID=UPI002615132F|nr:SDR family NAD(P)-dependent oxidoreductase [Sphingomonas bacterium]MDB5709950.1 dehydrogenase [Sphingomonas bacterium]
MQSYYQSRRLNGKRALITGAASGIGLACARRMAAEGAQVVLTDIDAVAGHAAAASIDGAGFVHLDVSEEGAWREAIATLAALDILVNNAGIGIGGDITKLSLDDWRRQQAVNLDGTFLGIKHALPLIRRSSAAGAIINIASVTGIRGSGVFVSYAASKGGVVTLTRAVARQCAAARDGVRVNAIAPGIIDTPIFARLEGVDGAAADPVETATRLVPLGHPGLPDDIAHAAVYLASNEARYVTGAVLPVDGGLLMG